MYIQFILIPSLFGLCLPLQVSSFPTDDSTSRSGSIPIPVPIAKPTYATTTTTTTTTNSSSNPYGRRRRVLLTNVKRQIGNSSPNPISNLHGQGKLGGGRLNVTDVSSFSEFSNTTTFKESKDVLLKHHYHYQQPEKHLPHVQNVNSNFNSITISKNSLIASPSRNPSFAIIKDLALIPGQEESSSSGTSLFFAKISSSHTKSKGDGDIYKSLIRRYNSVNDVHNPPPPPPSPVQVNDDGNIPLSASTAGTHLKEQEEEGVSFCPPVIVNQTLSLNYTDMDKWARTLVKITQCIANCLGSLSASFPYNKYNMSADGNFKMGGGSAPVRSNTKWNSSRISSPPLANSNGDIMIAKNNLNDKLLSSCQKSCKFLPRKSSTPTTTTTQSKTTEKKNVMEETNKENETENSTPTQIPIEKPIPVKPDDYPGHGLEITRSDTGLFHLRWPKITSSSSTGSLNKIQVVYTVILQDGDGEGRWKLIDQTVAQQTQISLVVDVCQTNLQIKTPLFSSPVPHPTIRVLTVSSKGFHKLFSGVLYCSCQEQFEVNHEIENLRKKYERKNYDKQVSTFRAVSFQNLNKASNRINHPSVSQEGVNIKFKKPPTTNHDVNIDSRKAHVPLSWGLRVVSMVYQNFLVVTEVSWDFPGGPSNPENILSNSTTSKSTNEKRSVSENENSQKKYQFLLTWETPGLRGNLVTDEVTSGTISLWPDTAYFIQVGLINNESPDLSFSSSSSSSSVTKVNGLTVKSADGNLQEQHQNYMSNLLGLESIILPLAEGEPKVTLKSERLLVNTSQVSIQTIDSSSSQFSSQRSSTDSIKSNNPLLQEVEHEKSFHPPLPLESSNTGQSTSLYVSPIIILANSKNTTTNSTSITSLISTTNTTTTTSGSTVSKNGNENDHRNYEVDHKPSRHNQYEYYQHQNGYMGDSPQAVRNDGEKDEKAAIHSYHNTSGKNLTGSSDTNGYQDKNGNINDNKSNNNLKSKKSKSPTTPTTTTADHHDESIFRGDIYQGLFALNIDIGKENKLLTAPGSTDNEKFAYANLGDGSVNGNSTKIEGPSVIYSVFVLIIVACVIFLFLVAFIGFFVVTSSIAKTAQYFVPKRVTRIWTVGGGNSENELLGGDNDHEEAEAEFDGHYGDAEELDGLDDDGPEWNVMDTSSAHRT